MNNVRSALCALLFLVSALMFATSSQAQATRTWVSGVGDDANPCSRTAPCKTFAGAISKTAVGGEIDALDSGGFGTVTITKSITIDGSSSLAGILAAGSTGININITDSKDTAKAVRLRGLSLNGVGTGIQGINVIAANSVTIEDSIIDGFLKSGINIGVGAVFVKDTSIRNNLGAGINVASGAQVAVANVSLIFNDSGMSGPAASISSLGNVFLYGNKNGDPRTNR